MSEALVYEAVRTPFGRFAGALGGIRPDDLAAHALTALLERAGALLGRHPLARVVACAADGVDPDVLGLAPVEVVNKALTRAGIGWDAVEVLELNEAFASPSPACLAGWPELDPARVNVRGGAIAIGHPLGASGARILGRLAHELRACGGGCGVATLCIGVGQGLAMIPQA